MFGVLALIAAVSALLGLFLPFGQLFFLVLAILAAELAFFALLSYGFGWPPPPHRRDD